jgi:hypothetical protein
MSVGIAIASLAALREIVRNKSNMLQSHQAWPLLLSPAMVQPRWGRGDKLTIYRDDIARSMQ